MSVMSFLSLGHLLGLALGLGGAFCAEMVSLRLLSQPVTVCDAVMLRRVSRMVMGGYVLLVCTGLGFLCVYAGATPEKLGNPKLWAKVTIVAALGLNGLVIHKMIMPRLAERIGLRLLEGVDRRGKLLAAGVGAVSTVSWLAALILGALRELNFAAPYDMFVGAYAMAVLLVTVAVLLVIDTAERRAPLRASAG